jgi:diguanylate cyclase
LRLPLLHRFLLGFKPSRQPVALLQFNVGIFQDESGGAMAVPSDEHERTLVFAEVALRQIKALRQPASPRNFEIWYQYATGYTPELNRSINETLAQRGTLGEADIDHIYNTYLSPGRVSDRLDTLGTRMAGEIKQVLDMIDTAAGSATSYSASLADASEKLQGASDDLHGGNDGTALRAVIELLVTGAKEMETSNKMLEARLSASWQEIEQLQQNLETVRTESLTDPLTTLANRKFFDAELRKCVAQAKAGNEPLALLMSDVDNFKAFNDKFGHLTGDQVLRLVAMSMKHNVKGRDIAARYGGEEFAIALPQTTLPSAIAVADHIRRAVMNKELMKRSSGERLGRVTISIGVALLRPTDTTQSLIERADKCLYAAKRNGRNQVIGESDAEAAAGAKIMPARVA